MSAGSSSDVQSMDRAEQIRRVVFELAQRRVMGDSVSDERIAAEHPELMPDLAAELAKLRRVRGALDEADDAAYRRAMARLAFQSSGPPGASGREPEPCGLPGSGDESTASRIEARSENGGGSEVPARIGRYRIRHLLGEGAFGRVYLAWDEELAREVAVKIPHPDHLSNPRSVEDYLAEARIVAGLDHPAIVPVYDVGRTADGCCYVVSKWIRGSDLQLP
ncbi:MAG: protein kinase [Pirellulales bacterium]|nr:protein kinase [Pirellulales bacterium]